MKLMVIMLDMFRTECSIEHLGEAVPFGRRIMEPHQIDALVPQQVGIRCGQEQFETYGPVWLEQ